MKTLFYIEIASRNAAHFSIGSSRAAKTAREACRLSAAITALTRQAAKIISIANIIISSSPGDQTLNARQNEIEEA